MTVLEAEEEDWAEVCLRSLGSFFCMLKSKSGSVRMELIWGKASFKIDALSIS